MILKKIIYILIALTNALYLSASMLNEQYIIIADQIADQIIKEEDSELLEMVTRDFSQKMQKLICKKLIEKKFMMFLSHHQNKKILSAHKGPIKITIFSSDEKYALTCCKDGLAVLWNLTQENITAQPLKSYKYERTSATFSKDNNYILIGSEDHKATLWDLTKEIPESKIIVNHLRGITSVAFNHKRTKENTASWEYSAEFSSDGKFVITAGKDSRATVWNLTTNPIASIDLWHDNPIKIAAFVCHDKNILIGDSKGYLYLCRLQNDCYTKEFFGNHLGPISSITFNKTRRYALTGSYDKTARFWDLRNSHSCIVLEGHTDAILSVSLSNDSRYALTGSADGTARIWDLHANPVTSKIIQRNIHTLEDIPAINSVAFSSNLKYAIIGQSNGEVYLFDISFENILSYQKI